MKKALFLLGLLLMANGMSHLLLGQNNGEPIVLEYEDCKFFNDEPDYKLFDEQTSDDDKYCGQDFEMQFCENTQMFYALDKDNQTVIEYDLKDAINKNIKKRTFRLPSKVANPFLSKGLRISPNGQRLAFVDENGENLYIVDISRGTELASCKLGKNYTGNGMYGYPLAFLSDNEILVTGGKKALLYDIDKKRSHTLSFDKQYYDYGKYRVNTNGTISGLLSQTIKMRMADLKLWTLCMLLFLLKIIKL